MSLTYSEVARLSPAAQPCMSPRGVHELGARTVTPALHGLIRDDARTRQELLALTPRTSHDQ